MASIFSCSDRKKPLCYSHSSSNSLLKLTGTLSRGAGIFNPITGNFICKFMDRNDDAPSAGRRAFVGALLLYQNFINLFMLVPRLATPSAGASSLFACK
jgi:hypothetical protein